MRSINIKGLAIHVTLLAILITTVTAPSAFADIKQGGTCSKLGTYQTSKGAKYLCSKSGSKLLWRKVSIATTSKPSTKPSSKPSPTPVLVNLLRVGVNYIGGESAQTGYYLATQMDPKKECFFSLVHYPDVKNKNKYIGGVGRTFNTNVPGIDFAVLTFRVEAGDEITLDNCDANYLGPLSAFPFPETSPNYPSIFWPGTYLVNVNILPGDYSYSSTGCAYTYSTKETPIEKSLYYGNQNVPTVRYGSGGIATIPNDAVGVWFSYSCTKLVKKV